MLHHLFWGPVDTYFSFSSQLSLNFFQEAFLDEVKSYLCSPNTKFLSFEAATQESFYVCVCDDFMNIYLFQ